VTPYVVLDPWRIHECAFHHEDKRIPPLDQHLRSDATCTVVFEYEHILLCLIGCNTIARDWKNNMSMSASIELVNVELSRTCLVIANFRMCLTGSNEVQE
jgi:hypothetical protein